jgi:hypothetical protein
MSYLPSDSWKYQQSLYSSFNNELSKGIIKVYLYDFNTDLNLYKPLDFKPLDNVNFDSINKRLDENDNLFNNAKSTISGGLSGLFDGAGKGVNNFFNDSLGLDKSAITTYLGLFLLFLII